MDLPLERGRDTLTLLVGFCVPVDSHHRQRVQQQWLSPRSHSSKPSITKVLLGNQNDLTITERGGQGGKRENAVVLVKGEYQYSIYHHLYPISLAPFPQSAFTAQTSPKFLREAGCSLCPILPRLSAFSPQGAWLSSCSFLELFCNLAFLQPTVVLGVPLLFFFWK